MHPDITPTVLEHYFSFMRDNPTWQREHKIIYAMWAEIERLRELMVEQFLSQEREATQLRNLLRRCEPAVCSDIGEWERLKRRNDLHPDAYVAADAKIKAGTALRDELRKAIGDDR